MIKASLRTTGADAGVQQNVAKAAAPAVAVTAPQPRPAAAPVRQVAPGVIHQRGGAPARVATPAAPVAAAPLRAPARPTTPAPAAVVQPQAPSTSAPAAVVQPAQPTTPAPAASVQVSAPVAPKAPRRPRKPAVPAVAIVPAAAAALGAEQPIIEVQATVTPTPVEGVTVESITTVAPAGSVEDQLLGAEVPATATAAEEAAYIDSQQPGAADEGPSDPTEAAPVAPAAAHALAIRPPTSVATRSSFNVGEGLSGDWGPEDDRFPRLQIVRGSGQLASMWNDGTLLYSDEPLLPTPSVVAGAQNPCLYFVPLSIRKGWRENLTKEEQDNGQLPRNASSIQEVEDAGGTTQWVGGQKPSWSPSAQCVLLLEKPEASEHPGFIVPLDGREYAVALYYVSGGDFNVFAKNIYNVSRTNLQVPILDAAGQPTMDAHGRVLKKTMLYKNYWTLQYAKVPRGQFQVWSPQIRLLAKEETGPEVRAYVENLMGIGVIADSTGE